MTLTVVATLVGLLASVAPCLTPDAEALSPRLGALVVHVAASKKGAPYVWGADGPRAFDCSGLTQWVFARVGRRLPRLASAQYRATRHIKPRQRRKGDLVFFHHGPRIRSIYHVAIYAGHGMIWEAPHTGARVREERIWSRKVWYGRVR